MGDFGQREFDTGDDESSALRRAVLHHRCGMQHVLCGHGPRHGARRTQVPCGSRKRIQLLLCRRRVPHARVWLRVQGLSSFSHLHRRLFHHFLARFLARSRVASILDHQTSTHASSGRTQSHS